VFARSTVTPVRDLPLLTTIVTVGLNQSVRRSPTLAPRQDAVERRTQHCADPVDGTFYAVWTVPALPLGRLPSAANYPTKSTDQRCHLVGNLSYRSAN